MTASVNKNSTKNQILEAYENLLKQVEEKSNDNPQAVQQRKQEAETVRTASKNNQESIISQINTIKTNFVASLETIERSLVQERDKLAAIQKAIAIEEQHLEELYGLKSNADALAAILLAQKEQKEHFEREMQVAKEALNAEINETKTAWQKDKKTYEEERKAEKELQVKARKREEEEYSYNLQSQRKQEEDEYTRKKSRQETELEEQRLAVEKDFAEREKSIKQSEKELSDLREEVATFSQRIETAVEKAQTDVREKLQTIQQYEKNLLEKETQGILNLKELQIKTLENKIKEMETQLKEAGVKVDNSEKTVKDIALKAIENSGKTQVVERERVKE